MTVKKTLHLLFLLMVISCHVVAQKQIAPKKYKLLTYGLPDFSRENAYRIVAEKWNIQFYAVAGCIVTEELQDSVRKENEKTHKLLEATYGKNWEEKFDAEVEAEYEIESDIDDLVKRQPFISNKEIVNPMPGAPFPMYPSKKTVNYIVKVSTYNNDWKEQKLYELSVDYKRKLVKILRDYTSR